VYQKIEITGGANLQRDSQLSKAVDTYIKNFNDFKNPYITRNEFTTKGKLIKKQFGRLQNALSNGQMLNKDLQKLQKFYEKNTANIITNNIGNLSFYKRLHPMRIIIQCTFYKQLICG
jgi:hypothetical protein